MKKTLTVFSTLFAVLCLSAQTPEQSARIQEIKADETKYFYGESTSLINNADAFNAAIQDMSRQVKSTVDLTITEMNDRYDTESIIRSAAAFNNVNKIDYSTERNGQKSYVTFVYISKADYIKQLKDRGASQEILSELTSYDFDDGSFIAENFAKMSDAEFKKINKLYSEREKLASDLANELYAPEMEELNTELVNTVIAEFETLPNKIHIIGSEALDSFIDGLSETENLSEKISDFTDSFFDACNNGILFGSADLNFTDSIINALSEQDIYAIGKEKGGELASGFNDALNDLYMKFTAQLNENILSEFQEIAASEQLYMANMHGSQYKLQTQNSHTPSAENIVLKNHVDTTVKVDGDTIGKVAYEYIQLHNFRTGE